MEIIIQPTATGQRRRRAHHRQPVCATSPTPCSASPPAARPSRSIRADRDAPDGLDFSRVTTFNLDEYVGLPREHPQSTTLHGGKPLPARQHRRRERPHPGRHRRGHPRRSARLRSDASATPAASTCSCSASARDGHIGFNEPTSSLASRTRIKTLTAQTREDNARFFGRRGRAPPRHHHGHRHHHGEPDRASCWPSARTRPRRRRSRRGPDHRDDPGLRSCRCTRWSMCPLDEEAATALKRPTTTAGSSTTSRTGKSIGGFPAIEYGGRPVSSGPARKAANPRRSAPRRGDSIQ